MEKAKMRLTDTAIAAAIAFMLSGVGTSAQPAAQDWRSYRGDISKWTGIPPPPPSASRTKTKTADVNCTIADAAGKMVSWFMVRSDCMKWIGDAQELAKSGPTPMQLYGYRIHQCLQKFSGRVQVYSGQFYTVCARSIPPPR